MFHLCCQLACKTYELAIMHYHHNHCQSMAQNGPNPSLPHAAYCGGIGTCRKSSDIGFGCARTSPEYECVGLFIDMLDKDLQLQICLLEGGASVGQQRRFKIILYERCLYGC